MAPRPDDFERLKRNPKGVRFADLERIILRAGFVLERDVRDVIRFLEEDV